MFARHAHPGQRPAAKRLAPPTTWRRPSSGPGPRRSSPVMAQRDQLQHRSGPRSSSRCPRSASSSDTGGLSPADQEARPAVSRGGLGSGRRRAADRSRRASVEARATRGRCALPVGGAGKAPTATTTRIDGPPSNGSGASRTNFGGPGRARAGEVEPADAEARSSDLGRGRQPPGLVNSTAYRQLVSRNGAGMKQGRHRAHLGRFSGGLGSYATPVRALNGGATPVCVVSSPERGGRSASRMGGRN